MRRQDLVRGGHIETLLMPPRSAVFVLPLFNAFNKMQYSAGRTRCERCITEVLFCRVQWWTNGFTNAVRSSIVVVHCPSLNRTERLLTLSANVTSFWRYTFRRNIFGSRPSDHYFRSVRWFVCLFVQFFSAVFDPISIKLGHMLHVWVYSCVP